MCGGRVGHCDNTSVVLCAVMKRKPKKECPIMKMGEEAENPAIQFMKQGVEPRSGGVVVR